MTEEKQIISLELQIESLENQIKKDTDKLSELRIKLFKLNKYNNN